MRWLLCGGSGWPGSRVCRRGFPGCRRRCRRGRQLGFAQKWRARRERLINLIFSGARACLCRLANTVSKLVELVSRVNASL